MRRREAAAGVALRDLIDPRPLLAERHRRDAEYVRQVEQCLRLHAAVTPPTELEVIADHAEAMRRAGEQVPSPSDQVWSELAEIYQQIRIGN